jgi:hypothetical protein
VKGARAIGFPRHQCKNGVGLWGQLVMHQLGESMWLRTTGDKRMLALPFASVFALNKLDTPSPYSFSELMIDTIKFTIQERL